MFIWRTPPQIGLAVAKALTQLSINPARNRSKTEILQDLALHKTSPTHFSLHQINDNNP